MLKTLKFAALYSRFEGFGVLQKHRKITPKWSPNSMKIINKFADLASRRFGTSRASRASAAHRPLPQPCHCHVPGPCNVPAPATILARVKILVPVPGHKSCPRTILVPVPRHKSCPRAILVPVPRHESFPGPNLVPVPSNVQEYLKGSIRRKILVQNDPGT